jgi:hypothetical protein
VLSVYTRMSLFISLNAWNCPYILDNKMNCFHIFIRSSFESLFLAD